MYNTAELFDLSHTLAGAYLAGWKYPWQALKGIKGAGWVIRVMDTKIVIVGTTPFLTRAALSYFYDKCLVVDKTDVATLTLSKKIILSGLDMISLSGEDGEGYTVVYGDDVDDQDGTPAERERSPWSVGGTGPKQYITEQLVLLKDSSGALVYGFYSSCKRVWKGSFWCRKNCLKRQTKGRLVYW